LTIVKRKIAIAALISVALGTIYLWHSRASPQLASGDPPMCVGGRCCCVRDPVSKTSSDPDRLTLDPNQFVGEVKQAYEFAGENPALLAQLWCYCGCDRTDGHRNLLDCYRGNHGATCAICTGEALLAKRMSENGSPVEQIREAIRDKFSGRE